MCGNTSPLKSYRCFEAWLSSRSGSPYIMSISKAQCWPFLLKAPILWEVQWHELWGQTFSSGDVECLLTRHKNCIPTPRFQESFKHVDCTVVYLGTKERMWKYLSWEECGYKSNKMPKKEINKMFWFYKTRLYWIYDNYGSCLIDLIILTIFDLF